MPRFNFSLRRVSIACLSFLFLNSAAFAVEGYFRWPSAHGETLVFSAEGDLWRQREGEAQAVRLTSHNELESQAAISPDGQQVAFVASFDGSSQIYMMPITGGTPKQVTFESVSVEISQWSSDGRILYTSRNMEGPTRVRELRLVDPDSLVVERIPLRYASSGTFDDEAKTLFFTRHGISTVSDNARLYRGGGMSQLWRYEIGSGNESIHLASDFDGPIESPMYFDGRLYFVSDQSGFDNIWSMRTNGTDIQQHSSFAGWRLRGASLHDGVIHYQRGADIFAFDIASAQESLVQISLATDRDRSRLRWISDPLNYLDDANIAGSENQVALTARGRVAVASIGNRRRVELSIARDARARAAVPGVNGEWVYAIVDSDDRGEIWRFAADGSGNGEQLTFDADDHRWDIKPSPDGNWLIHHDKSSRLWKLNLATGENSLIMENISTSDNDYGSYSFSRGGRYMAFHTSGSRRDTLVIMVHDFANEETVQVTEEKYRSLSPTFSKDGDWLYFISERHFQASPSGPWGDRNLGPAFDKRSQLFALRLDDGAVYPFTEPNELSAAITVDEEGEPSEPTINGGDPEINWNAVGNRIFQLPVAAGNYSNLQAAETRLFLVAREGSKRVLQSLPMEFNEPKLVTFAENVADFQLSAEGESIFYRTGGSSPNLIIAPVNEKAPDELDDYRVRTQGWRLALEPAQEWRQMFLDAWRMHRDFAFDSTLRGVDWDGVRSRLLPLAARIGHRSDLNDLLGQMASEIGILHSQIRPGDLPDDTESAALSSLGARYAPHARGLEIVQIYQGESERPETMGPLSQPEDDIAVGDVIIAINNRPITNRSELERALLNQNDQQVLISTLRDSQLLKNIVTPVTTGQETMLRYLDWTGANETKVAQASQGEIGYLHLRAMGGGDVASFTRDFFPQTHLDGLIVDVRDNSGGNVDSWIIQQFLREVWAYWQREPGTPSYGNMQHTFRGHLAVLINAGTYSDGESFAAGIKALELGTLIGERTAGAGIWLSDRNRLADGGMSRVAELPQYGLDGSWLIEGEGISPDIEVVAEPHALFNGNDQQINAAVQFLLDKIEDEPIPELSPLPLPPFGGRGQDVEISN